MTVNQFYIFIGIFFHISNKLCNRHFFGFLLCCNCLIITKYR
ncbi:hypothetical protein [Moraxella lacunata]